MIEIINNWYDAYRLIALLLIEKHGQSANPAMDIYKNLKDTEFSNLNKGRLFRDSLTRTDEWGLDPIQIFSTFNYTKIDPQRRIKLINSLLYELGSERSINIIAFEGIPTPIITQIAQYRGFKQQNEIWRVFIEVVKGGLLSLKSEHFDKIKSWRGIDIASFTMFLFWINSDEFLPIDKNTVDFLKSISILDFTPKSYPEYIFLCNLIKDSIYNNYSKKSVYRDLVLDSYKVFNFEKEPYDFTENTASIINKYAPSDIEKFVITERIPKEKLNGFKIIAIRPKIKPGYRTQHHLKNLIEGELYQFYNSYTIIDNDKTIVFDKTKSLDLYSDKQNINISISAIVGTNGSGKSTIAELLYLAINKIAYIRRISPEQKLINTDIHVDLFIHLDTIYKISIGNDIEFFKYRIIKDNTYQISNETFDFANFDFANFFYTVAVNYSLYALNSEVKDGQWLNPLFWKNDSYQIPLALNPIRKGGNIDINIEEDLAKSRMLSNILDPDLFDFEKKEIQEIAPECTPKYIKLTLNKGKISKKLKKYEKEYQKVSEVAVDKIVNILTDYTENISIGKQDTKIYIFLKVVEISNTYSLYKGSYHNLPDWVLKDEDKLNKLLNDLKGDTSHITFKLRQAINFYKYGIFEINKKLSIIDVISKIDKYKSNTDLRTIDLLPPSFFDIDLTFESGSTFNNLSSGQKQLIFSVNTIGYHLYNINSVGFYNDNFKYSNVNIIFDEVELYFHPEMQRSYINDLLLLLKNLQVDKIYNINIIFITHSPFILSDIPSTNILRLKSGKPNKTKNSEETFGANIHDLLANDFFLEKGYMGEFANKKIQEVITTLKDWEENHNDYGSKEKDELFKFIQLIGEPLIKKSLLDLYHEKIGIHDSEFTLDQIEEEIKRLENLKERINK